MEQVHGIDTSWVHTPNKNARRHAASVPSARRDVKPPSTTQDSPRAPVQTSPNLSTPPTTSDPRQDSNNVTQTTRATPPTTSTPNAAPTTPTANGRAQPRRPSLLQRSSSEKTPSDGRGLSRKSSWLNNIGSKFSSSTPDRPNPTQTQQQKPSSTSAAPSIASQVPSSQAKESAEEIEPYVPSKPKDQSSFFSSLTRRFSSASQAGGTTKVLPNGGVCARRVLNVDPNRERRILPEMDPSKLRKVSFCVDVEVAGGPTYREEEDEQERSRRKKEFKMKERAEGEALKHPEAVKDEKENEGVAQVEAKAASALQDDPRRGSPPKSSAIDIDKKKRTDEERRERLEKRKRRAEENGSIPVEMSMQDDLDLFEGDPSSPTPSSTPEQAAARLAKHDRPTTDPVRIYRRCCQLRESPILKRITEQLMSPTCTVPFEPGVVNCLDLTHSRLQLADVVTLGDWLAVVPVKHLKLEDADINDEGVRCILAGLLAAKRPEPSRRRSGQPRHRQHWESPKYQERAGVIEKITFKNNPRITRVGFKHISLFLYLCRSIKAVDLSMNLFPATLPGAATTPANSNPHNTNYSSNSTDRHGTDLDTAEIFFKCLSERLGGSQLEELVMSECRLDAEQIRKVVDSAVICGVKRLGLAGNNIDNAGLEHVIRYVRSGVCNAIDIGSNDFRENLDMLANAIETKSDVPLWGLSLADCNLDSNALKLLFQALVKLPDFRFIDLSHNRDLCNDNTTISFFRRYMSQLKHLKRVHLADVGMSPMQAIALADALPDGPSLAHLNILENKQLTALAHARSEADQEEACALYASLMAAVRVSSTLICIDIDVPSAKNNEIVKALAKQVVAYSLRNMEQFAIAEATGVPTADATAKLTEPHGGERGVREMTVPDVLMHLVGHVDGVSENHDNDDPAPDEDYIVGGTGVVKALQYVLGEKANDLRRTSVPSTPIGGSVTPKERSGSSMGLEEQRGKAKMMSKDLLEAARKIRGRLQPALLKEAGSGDEMAYRRLLFLDSTLQSMIQRFEEEYPETRKGPPIGQSPVIGPSIASSLDTLSNTELSISTQMTDANTVASESDDEDGAIRTAMSRRNSDVSLASKALSEEEGRLHRIGQKIRRDVINTTASSPTVESPGVPKTTDEEERLRTFAARIEALSGTELRSIVEVGGWGKVLERLGGNYEDLRKMYESDPQGWKEFEESQLKARMNLDREKGGQPPLPTPQPNSTADA